MVRRKVNEIAVARGEWAGAPIPLEHCKLIMEPRYPWPGMHGAQVGAKATEKEAAPFTVINSWHCFSRQAWIYVLDVDGKRCAGFDSHGPGRRMRFWIDTLGVAAAEVWTIEAEANALEKLKGLVTAQAYKCYVLSGTFLETSKRSLVTYLFRKLRPTVALRPDKAGMMEVLTCLCLHPLGYYDQTWAGVMTPTDDVIAHLLMMRGCEHRFWRKANHHGMYRASAGI